jgi:hypothetical protein
VQWVSENLNMGITYLDIGKAFDAQLGYVPVTGVRSTTVFAIYKTLLSTDLQKKFLVGGGINDTKDRNDVLVYDHSYAIVQMQMANGGSIQLTLLPSVDNVARAFALFAGRVNIPAARYNALSYNFRVSTAPRLPVVATLGYTGGDLFAGTQSSPTGSLQVNLGSFTTNGSYQYFLVRYNGQEINAQQVTAGATYSYSPLARSTITVSGNTLVDRAVAQFITIYQFGLLSTLSFVVSKSTGANQIAPNQWLGPNAPLSVYLSLAYGVSPF